MKIFLPGLRIIWFFLFALAFNVNAQNIPANKGKVVTAVLQSAALANTTTHEDPNRSLHIYLPRNYETTTKRYPVVYLLHGYGGQDTFMLVRNKVYETLDRGIAENKFGEMIVVAPNNKSKMNGSWYTNSTSSGNWEDFNAKELVSYMDKNYRTITKPEARAVVGHSMGGFGAIQLGMRHPDVFGVVYAMSPGLMDWGSDFNLNNPYIKQVQKLTKAEEVLPNFYLSITVAMAQAFSPNPNKPPFYCDFPITYNGEAATMNEAVMSAWEKHIPVKMISEYAPNLRKLKGIKIDAGIYDGFAHIPIACRYFSEQLSFHNIDHSFELYNGDHGNRLYGPNGGRMFTDVLPFVWDKLYKE